MEEEAIAYGALDVEINADSIFTFLTTTETVNQIAQALADSGHDLVNALLTVLLPES